MKLTEGDRVYAPDKDDIIQRGVLEDDLSVQWFVRFEDGSDNFVWKTDRRIHKIED